MAKAVIARALRGNRREQRHSFFNDLEAFVVNDRILESTCNDHELNEEGRTCQVCRFERQLGLPHLPEMIFPYNSLVILVKMRDDNKQRVLIEFNAYDALKCVDKEHLPDVKVGPSDVWKNARRDVSSCNPVHAFDWTFTSNYQGTVGYGIRMEKANENECIDYERLKRRDPIHFYEQITLYEDELADNGCAQVCDTRIYGTAENREFVLRESTRREANYSALSKEAIAAVLDPNQIGVHLPLEHTDTMKLLFS